MKSLRHYPFADRRSIRGVTLIELISFIAIVGIVAVGMIQAFSGTMHGSYYGKEMTHGTQLAQERMEIILGQRKRLGYTAFVAGTYDPCTAPIAPWNANQACLASSYAAGNFIVSSLPAPVADSCGTGCSVITVTVTSPYGDTLSVLTSQVWNY